MLAAKGIVSRDTGHARGVGLRDSMVSSSEADSIIEDKILLPRNILYDRKQLASGLTGQRMERTRYDAFRSPKPAALIVVSQKVQSRPFCLPCFRPESRKGMIAVRSG